MPAKRVIILGIRGIRGCLIQAQAKQLQCGLLPLKGYRSKVAIQPVQHVPREIGPTVYVVSALIEQMPFVFLRRTEQAAIPSPRA